MSKIKSFRGQIVSGTEQTIALHTNNGSTGYIIRKFEIMPGSWGSVTQEICVKVHTVPGKPADVNIDFDDQTLLAAACVTLNASANTPGDAPVVIFDNITFNQDIYVVAVMDSAAPNVNYHIELEQVKLDLNENTVATLKDIRNVVP